jgi:hypothetical protein
VQKVEEGSEEWEDWGEEEHPGTPDSGRSSNKVQGGNTKDVKGKGKAKAEKLDESEDEVAILEPKKKKVKTSQS